MRSLFSPSPGSVMGLGPAAAALIVAGFLVAACASSGVDSTVANNAAANESAPTTAVDPDSTVAPEPTTTPVSRDYGCLMAYPPANDSPYRLPFAAGDSYQTGLTNCSSSFHSDGQPDALAFDFNLPVDDTVLATRGGQVTFVRTSDQNGSGSPGGNQVNIDHGDGTVGIYLHFSPDTVQVTIGDSVAQGDPLGASGFSGTNAGYPHLHFIVVEAPGDYPWNGLPITFANADPNDEPLRSNTVYTATG